MHLKEINPDKTPELFYCGSWINEYVEEHIIFEGLPEQETIYRTIPAHTEYDQVAEDTSDSNDCIRSLRKKVYGGDAEFKMYADHIEIAYNGLTIARAELVANYYTTSWQSVAFDFTSANITRIDDGTFRFVVVQGNNVFGLEWSFAYGIQTKQTFYLDVPGRDVRIQWRTEVLDNALATNRDDNKGLRYSVEDYEGEFTKTTPIHPTDGWSYHIWTFEPDGYACDVADARTPLERYIDGAGLTIDPYLELDEASSTITVETADDTLVFTVATYDAVVIENAVPIRVVIEETNIVSTIYPEIMFQYGDGTSSVTGNTYSAIEISDDLALYNWFPLNSTIYGNRVAATAQFVNDSDLTFTTGTAKTSGTGHTSIGTDGFASDGAYHVEPAGTGGDIVNLDVGQIEHKTNVVLHDFPYTSGDGAVDYLDEKFNTFDDNAANSTITADIGNNANWEAVSDGSNRNTNTSGDSVSTDYGTGLDTQNGAGYIDFALGNYLNAFFIKGSILIRCQPQFSYNDAADQVLWHCYVDANNYLLLFYDAGTDQFHFTVVWGSTSTTVTSAAYTADDELQLYQLIKLNWDSTTNKIELNINGKVVDSDTNTGTPSSSNPAKVTIGAMQDRSLPGDFILISAYSFDTPVFSYGAYFTGNTAAQLAEGMYHEDITFYDTLTTSASTARVPDKIGASNIEWAGAGASPSVSGAGMHWTNTTDDGLQIPVIDYFVGDFDTSCEGSILFKYIPDSTGTPATHAFFIGSSGNNAFRFFISAVSGYIYSYLCGYGDSGDAGVSWVADQEYIIRILFRVITDGVNQLIYRRIEVDGVIITEQEDDITSANIFGTNIYIGNKDASDNESCLGTIKDFYIVSDPNTPQIDTFNGVPRDWPIMRDD